VARGRCRFIPNQWNRVTLAHVNGIVNLSINDELVYQRVIDFAGATQFGFYRENRNESARMRNVVMSGDWPKQVPHSFIDDLVTLKGESALPKDESVSWQFIGEDNLASNFLALRREIMATEAEKQYERLCRWVFPSAQHPSTRVIGMFAPTNASPPIGYVQR
jgi:hypothetical protein